MQVKIPPGPVRSPPTFRHPTRFMTAVLTQLLNVNIFCNTDVCPYSSVVVQTVVIRSLFCSDFVFVVQPSHLLHNSVFYIDL